MERIHRRLLEALGAFLHWERVTWEDMTSAEWDALLNLAREHHVMPMVLEAVQHCSAFQTADPEQIGQMRRQVRQIAARQLAATEAFLQVYPALRQAGAHPLVVKGIICRSLYPVPELRRSGDEDVLIDPKEYWLCKMALAEQGLVPEAAADDAYEVPFRDPDGALMIELHRSLFPADSQAYGHLNNFFSDAPARAVEVTVQGQSIWTLCPTDHILYLVCHAFKHFLHGGFGIRQVCDMALYANRYGSAIDWEQVLTACRSIRAEKFAAALFAIGREHLTFDPASAGYPPCWQEIPVDPQPLLEELLLSGIYGQTDPARLRSGNMILNEVAAQKQGKRARNGLAASLFPPARSLQGRYPFLRKHPWMVSVAWAHRFAQYATRSRRTDSSHATDVLRQGNHRLDLLRLYGIID